MAAKIYSSMVAASLPVSILSNIAHFDRGDTTISSAASRNSAYYNKLKPHSFHITELSDYIVYNEYFETGYKDKLFLKETGNNIERILFYAVKQTGSMLTVIKKFCGII